MIYFSLLALPLLVAPFRTLPNTKALYKIFVGCYFIALALLTGLRWNIGTDWDSYHDFFVTLDNRYWTFEPGYVWLSSAVKYITRDYTVFLLIDAALALLPIWYVLKKRAEGSAVALALFFSYYFTIHYIGSNRRIIAIGLCFLALYALTKNKNLIFVLLCGAAFLFHRSSLIFLLAWPIYRMKSNKWVFMTMIAVSIFVQAHNPFKAASMFAGSGDSVLISKVVGYSDNSVLDENINYGVQNAISIVKRSLFVLLAWWAYSKQREEAKAEYGGLLNLYVFSFALYIMFTGTVEMFKSLTVYFSIVELLLLPIAFRALRGYLRPFAYILFCAFIVVQQYSALNSYWDLYVPYRSVISRSNP